ncbi:hypothetical protein OIDMADRAFT_138377 [Oidiodendron maius Zn]|uniref:Carbohydrate-binding module family 19 domain-containing protein n=1 Tax=Oidiodendron maius (strain Zn) TaxID=913774 RepID=A0A0C3C2Q2_OIDMZ|nr:hypothetical protein OIDMADRAFT_138377 [Oidiodendron maius Zn]
MRAQIFAVTSLYVLNCFTQAAIYSRTGFGTYYYNVGEVDACGNDFTFQNKGLVECSLSTALSLDQVNSEYLVAMNHSQLIGDMAMYCGKKVIVSVNGVPSSLPLFIGDGCQRCGTGSPSSTVWDPNGAPGLDFSYSVLSELSANACIDGHIPISWEIVDETLYTFDTNASGSPEEPSAGSTRTVSDEPSTTASPTCNNSIRPCATGTWQCNMNVLEQCIDGSWIPYITCATGFSCYGGNVPYCMPYIVGEGETEGLVS